MNINKFTQKSMEAVQNCEKLAYEHGNQQLEQEHLLYSLLTLEDSLILKLITKMNISKEMFMNEAEQAVNRLTKVSGGGQLYVSNDLNKVLISAEDEAKAMGDEYVSVEHLFLAMLKQPDKNCLSSMVSPERAFCRHFPRSEVIREWSVIIRKQLMIRWRNMAMTW